MALLAGFGASIPPDSNTQSIEYILRAMIVQRASAPSQDAQDVWSNVEAFYDRRSYSPAWLRQGIPTAQALALIGVFENASSEGLAPEDYDAARWSSRLIRVRTPNARQEDLAAFDLSLSLCTFRYVADLHFGRVDPKELHFNLDFGRGTRDFVSWVSDYLVNSPDPVHDLDQIEPPFAGYKRTKRALQAYQAIASNPGCAHVAPLKQTAEPRHSYPEAAGLATLLRCLGDLTSRILEGSSNYSEPLVRAVKRFQARHGLDSNGRIDQITLKQLNVPLARRVEQLTLTLERWRWAPHEFKRSPIVVNIPEFMLRALNGEDRTELQMKVVVGQAWFHETPVFSAEMNSVVFRPYWEVPYGITRRELLPKIRKNSGFLRKHNYDVVSSSGLVEGVRVTNVADLASGRLCLRQKPGANNALGAVKFLLPNPYNVYLHDTPATELFAKSRRDFSHGCIRVERAEELVNWVLRGQAEWTAQRIHEAMRGGRTITVPIANPIPVLILYGTAVVPESGEVHFADDIYGHDAALSRAIGRRPNTGSLEWPIPPTF
jgi:murein L,D-transpeptidase YcbB/YkuD